MQWTYENLMQARNAVEGLLLQLKLDTYRFAVEPRGDHCEVRVEYAAVDGWKSTTLSVDDGVLLRSQHDLAVRSDLALSWQRRLSGAKHQPNS